MFSRSRDPSLRQAARKGKTEQNSVIDINCLDNQAMSTLEERQAKLVEEAELQTKSPEYQEAIAKSFDGQLQITGEKIGLEAKRGKVRDRIEINEKSLALVTTDRQSGFDRNLALVPFKGAVLNLTSAFWFEKTRDIIPNHLLAVPHPYVTIAKKCEPFPIEFVVR